MAQTTTHLSFAPVTINATPSQESAASVAVQLVVAPHRPSDAPKGQPRIGHDAGGRLARVQPGTVGTLTVTGSRSAPKQPPTLAVGAVKETLYSFRPLPSPLACATQRSVNADAGPVTPTIQVVPAKTLQAAKLLPNDAYSPCHVTGLLSLTDGSDVPDKATGQRQAGRRRDDTRSAAAGIDGGVGEAPVAAFHALQLRLEGGGGEGSGGNSSDNLLGGATTMVGNDVSGPLNLSVNDSASPRLPLVTHSTTPLLTAVHSREAPAPTSHTAPPAEPPSCSARRPADTQLYLLQLLQVVQEIRIEQTRSRRELNQVLWQCEQQAQALHALRRDVEALRPSASKPARRPPSPHAAGGGGGKGGSRVAARRRGGNTTAMQLSVRGDEVVSERETAFVLKEQSKATASATQSHGCFVQRLRRRTASVVEGGATATGVSSNGAMAKQLAEEVHTPRWGRGGGGGRVRAGDGGRDAKEPLAAPRVRHTGLMERDVNVTDAVAGRRGQKGDVPRRVSIISWVNNTSLPSYDDPGEQSVSTISTASCALEGHDTAVEEMQRQLGALQGNESGLQPSPSPCQPPRCENVSVDDTSVQVATPQDDPAQGVVDGDRVDSGATTRPSAPSLMSTTRKPQQTADTVAFASGTEPTLVVQKNKENGMSPERLFLTALPPPTRRVSQPLRRQTIITAVQHRTTKAITKATERGNRTTLQPATHSVTGHLLGANDEPPVRRTTSNSLHTQVI